MDGDMTPETLDYRENARRDVINCVCRLGIGGD